MTEAVLAPEQVREVDQAVDLGLGAPDADRIPPAVRDHAHLEDYRHVHVYLSVLPAVPGCASPARDRRP